MIKERVGVSVYHIRCDRVITERVGCPVYHIRCDRVIKERVVCLVYHIRCDNCEESYIGEMRRSLESRFMEHRRASSVNSEVSRHVKCDQPDHSISVDNVRIMRWNRSGLREQ